MAEFTPTTSTAGTQIDEAAPPTARKRGRPTKPPETPPRAKPKAKASKPPPKARPARKAPEAAPGGNRLHTVRVLLRELLAGTMTPELQKATLEYSLLLLDDVATH